MTADAQERNAYRRHRGDSDLASKTTAFHRVKIRVARSSNGTPPFLVRSRQVRGGDKSWALEEAHYSGCWACRCRSSCYLPCFGITDEVKHEHRLNRSYVLIILLLGGFSGLGGGPFYGTGYYGGGGLGLVVAILLILLLMGRI